MAFYFVTETDLQVYFPIIGKCEKDYCKKVNKFRLDQTHALLLEHEQTILLW